MKPNKRIASLLRELAEAFDDLEREEKQSKPRRRGEKTAQATRAAEVVKEGLRREGIR